LNRLEFRDQLDYFMDFRVVFDYFFPGLLPGSPVRIPDELMQDWESVYVPRILETIREYPWRTPELLRVTRAVCDPDDPETIGETVYRGSSNDRRLNAGVGRFTADPEALRIVASVYQTAGTPLIPMVTGHTIGDPVVTVWHERQYREKVYANGAGSMHTNLMVRRYGHCNFTVDEVLRGFRLLVLKVTGRETPAGSQLEKKRRRWLQNSSGASE
jgi:hypothetical protein